MNSFNQKVMFMFQHFLKSQLNNNSCSKTNTKKFLRFVLVSIIAPVKLTMMPSAPPTTELPPPAAHQRPKISFSIDSIVSDGPKSKQNNGKGKDEDGVESTSDFNAKVLHRSHSHSPVDLEKPLIDSSSLLLSRDLQKFGLFHQLRNVHQNPLINLHNQIQQQINFNNQRNNVNHNNGAPGSSPLSESHLRYNFHAPSQRVPQSIPDNESAVNNRVTSNKSPTNAKHNNSSVLSSRSPSPSPSDSRKSPLNQSPTPVPGNSSPDSRSAGSPPTTIPNNRSGEHQPMQNVMHLPPPVQMGPQIQHFPPFPHLGGPNFPGIPGAHPHHPGLPWGPHPNAGHPPVAHPLYPWLLARHTRLFPPRFGPGAELPPFLFQPFRKPKRIRTAFSPSQLLRLEHAFEKNHYVVGQERKQIAKALSLSETQVKVWFQNRRTKFKRESEGDGPNNSLCGPNSSGTSADSSTRHYTEEMSDDEEELIMDGDYSADEEEMAQVRNNM